MLLATHFAVGLAIGSRLTSPEAAFLLGFLSHFVLDRIPHWDGVEAAPDGKVHWKDHKNLFSVWRDIAIAAALSWYAVSQGLLGWGGPHAVALWGVFGALFPDMLWIPHHIFGVKRPARFFEFHLHIQREADRLPSILFQIALVVFGFVIAATA